MTIALLILSVVLGLEAPFPIKQIQKIPASLPKNRLTLNAEKLSNAIKVGEGIRTRNNLKIPPLDLVERYTWFTAATYCYDDELANWDCYSCTPVGYRIRFVKGFENTRAGTRGYVALDDTNKRIILTFRATENDKNMVQNYYLAHVPFLELGDPTVMVSHGPLLAMQSVASQFKEIISKLINEPSLSDYKLAVLGHSSGSTMASLAAAYLKASLKIKSSRMELYVYGMPRVGNFRYAEWYNRQDMAIARVVNGNDKFPHIIEVPGSYFVHHQNELWVRGRNRDGKYNITICDQTVFEDPKCSNSIPNNKLGKDAHTVMFDVDYLDDLC